MRPLEGITVVSLEQAVAAPFATRQLADLGARVIKIERPGVGDFARGYDKAVFGESSYFVWLNRSKESLTLDIKSTEGLNILHSLLSEADVFLQNLGPGAVDRLGLGADDLAKKYPRLIHTTISGYGTSGDWSNRKAYDLLVQAEAGLVSITGTEHDVARVGVSIADIAAGMYAYSGILTALIQRASTGKGTKVEISLFEALAEWMGSPAYYAKYSGVVPPRVGAQHATIAPYGPFESADGDTVMLAVQNEREWAQFCTVIMKAPELAERDEFSSNSARVANRALVNETIQARFSQLSTSEAIALLDEARIANARVNTIPEFLDHPALRSRGRWHTIGSPGGDVEVLLPPADIAGVEPRMDAVPALGAHTEEILAAMGYSADSIQALRDAGTV